MLRVFGLVNLSKDINITIEVQYQKIYSLYKFTKAKAREVVHVSFELAIGDQSFSWKCLQIEDCFLKVENPMVLENGKRFKKFQLSNFQNTCLNWSAYEPVRTAKSLDKWLLILEEQSCFTAHIDIRVAKSVFYTLRLDYLIRFFDLLGVFVAKTFVTGLIIFKFGRKTLHFVIGFGIEHYSV